MKRPLLGRADILFLTVLLAAILLFAWTEVPSATGRAGRIIITCPGGERLLVADPPGETTVAGRRGAVRLDYGHGTVRVAGSDCPRGICSHHGWLGGTDDVIVCVPNQVVVRRETGGGLDAVTR